MKKNLFLLLVLLFFLKTNTNAQCAAPTGADVSVTNITSCPNTGQILISNVTGGSGVAYYAITSAPSNFSSAELNVLHQITSTPIQNLPPGDYTIQIKYNCNNVFSTAITRYATITSSYTNLDFTTTVSNQTCSNPGSITVNATGGNPAYKYSLVSSLNVVTDSSSAQTNNVFNNLQVGTYYVRLFDNCPNNYITKSVSVGGTASSVGNPFSNNQYIGAKRTGCNSFSAKYWHGDGADGVTTSLVAPDGSTVLGSSSTMSADSFVDVSSYINASYATTYNGKTLYGPFTANYSNACGVTASAGYFIDTTFDLGQLNYAISSSGGCGSSTLTVTYTYIGTVDTNYYPSGITYIKPASNAISPQYSFDNGNTWTNSDSVVVTQSDLPLTAMIKICGRVLSANAINSVSDAINNLDITLVERNLTACEGLSGFMVLPNGQYYINGYSNVPDVPTVILANNNYGNGSLDNSTIRFTSGPTGNPFNTTDSFDLKTGYLHGAHSVTNFIDLPVGTYNYIINNGCNVYDTGAITITHPAPYNNKLWVTTDCSNGTSVLHVKLDMAVITTASPIWKDAGNNNNDDDQSYYYKLIRGNDSTVVMENWNGRFAADLPYNLTATNDSGYYELRVWPTNSSYWRGYLKSCYSSTLIYVNKASSAFSEFAQIISCGSGPGVVYVQPNGGMPPYTATLEKSTNAGSSWSTLQTKSISGPETFDNPNSIIQASDVANTNNEYRVTVSDACGHSTSNLVSNTFADFKIFTEGDCPATNISLYAFPLPNATYVWTHQDDTLAVSTGNTYNISNYTSANAGLYTVTTTIAGCPSPTSASISVSDTACATVLPVTITSFTGKALNSNSNLLDWSIANEINFSHYEIEKSTDSKNFEKIGIINTIGKTNYQFIDSLIAYKANYYRLKMVDLDGNFSYSKIVPILNNFVISTQIVAIPNPIVNSFKLKLTGSSYNNQNVVVLIHTTSGATIVSQKATVDLDGSIYINNTTFWPSGTYVISVYSVENKLIGTVKVTKA